MDCIEKILLYGSRAKGTNAPRADIDLAIICPSCSPKDWQNILDIIENADTLLSIDCVRFNMLKEHEPLKKNILQDHIVLYEKKL